MLSVITFEEMLFRSGTAIYVITDRTPIHIMQAVYKQFREKAAIAGFVGVDTEGSVKVKKPRALSPRLVQLCAGDMVVIQALHPFRAPTKLLGEVLTSASIMKIFFDIDQDLTGLQTLIKCTISPCLDLQKLTTTQMDTKRHGLKDALTRLDGVNHWHKMSFSQRGFLELSNSQMLRSSEFLQYAAADAFATYTGFNMLIAKLQLQREDWVPYFKKWMAINSP